jgi:hypothetical protein
MPPVPDDAGYTPEICIQVNAARAGFDARADDDGWPRVAGSGAAHTAG